MDSEELDCITWFGTGSCRSRDQLGWPINQNKTHVLREDRGNQTRSSVLNRLRTPGRTPWATEAGRPTSQWEAWLQRLPGPTGVSSWVNTQTQAQVFDFQNFSRQALPAWDQARISAGESTQSR